MTTTRTAIGIYFTDGNWLSVGQPWCPPGMTASKESPTITAITVTDDLPGLHANMERARVYVGGMVVWESPVHALEGIHYEGEQ